MWGSACLLLVFAAGNAFTIPRLHYSSSRRQTSAFMSKEDRIITTPVVNTSLRSKSDPKLSQFSDNAIGWAALLTVPVVWGTYVPLIRLLYSIDPPVPGFLFSAAYFALASVTTFGLLSVQEASSDTARSTTERFPVVAGLELGGYLFLGNCLQVVGLETVSADKAGFLVQLTTILVPIVSSLGNMAAVSGQTWVACIIALSGIVIMDLDVLPNSISMASMSSGEALVLSAALCYTLHVIRLGHYAKYTTPLKLAASKATVEALLSFAWVAFLVSVSFNNENNDSFLLQQGHEISNFIDTLSTRIQQGTLEADTIFKLTGSTLWAGWISTAYVVYAQSLGQSRVGPSNANLIYSLQPIFTAMFAYWLLGETLDGTGLVGGGLICGAVLLVASGEWKKNN